MLYFIGLAYTQAAPDICFRSNFDNAIAPTVGAELSVSNHGAVLVAGRDGNALRVGIKGSTRCFAAYVLPPEKRDGEKTGHGLRIFPLSNGSVELDFRPHDWEVGRKESGGLVQVVGEESGYLSVSYRHLRGLPHLQVVYGVMDRGKAAKGKLPFRYHFLPIQFKGRGHWYHVAVTWTDGDLRLRVDESQKTYTTTELSIPKYDGWKLELGACESRTVRPKDDGLTDIDNLVVRSVTRKADPAKAARTPWLRIPRASGVIDVDGKLADDAWRSAAQITGFMFIRENHFAHHQPHVWLTYDDRCLYVAVRAPIHDGGSLIAKATERDDRVWSDDCVEIFLDPTPDTEDFYQFAVNSTGVLADAGYHLTDKARMSMAWNLAGVRARASVASDAWVAEISLPFAGLGMSEPGIGHQWLFNVCESRIGLGCLSVCTLRRGYAERDRFGALAFGGECPAARIEGFGALDGGLLALSACYRHGKSCDAQVTVKGSRYDETANAFFPVFARNGTLGQEAGVLVRADQKTLRSHGTLDVSVTAGAEQLYRTRIDYRVLTDVEIETMRRIVTDAGPQLRVTTLQPPGSGRGGRRIRVRALAADDTEVRAAVAKITGSRMNIGLDLAGLEPGDHQAVLELLDADGNVLNADKPRPFTVYPDPPPWRGNKLGIGDRVPPPWTPLTVAEDAPRVVSVKCWNREYRFGPKSLLLDSVVSGGREYLQGPMRVVLGLDGKRLDGGTVTHRVRDLSDRECGIGSTRSGNECGLSAAATVEFDGFIWVDLTLAFAERIQTIPSRIDTLKITWDMPRQQSRLLNSGYRSLENTGKTPERWSKRLDGALWVGNEYGGISFAVESLANWSNRDADRQVEVVRTGQGTRVTINIVDEPIVIRGKRVQYSFCLHPTPIRPRPQGHRRLRDCSWMGTHHMKKPYPVNMSFWNSTAKYHGAPEWLTEDADIKADHLERNRKYKPRIHTYRDLAKSGARSTWYATYSHTARNTPEFIWRGEDWRCGHRDKLYGNAHYGYTDDMVAVCKTKDYRDYFLWRLDKSRRENALIDGIYFDLMHLERCNREDHGHGYVDAEGRRKSTVQIREHRDWLLRVYTYLKADDPQTPVLCHLSGHTAQIMAQAFCDYLWDGELWIREVQRDRSYENLRLDTFRAEALSSAYGPQISWINQLGRALTFLTPAERRKRSLKPYAARHAYALQLVHDALPGGSNRFQPQTIELWKAFDRFDLDDGDRFLPYWETDTSITLTPCNDEIVASAYVKPTRALVVVFNNTSADQDVTLRMDAKSVFGAANGKSLLFRDSEVENSRALARGGAVKLSIGCRDFRLVRVDSE